MVNEDPGNGNGAGQAERAPEVRALEAEFRALETSILLARAEFARQAGITFGGARDEYEILGYDRIISNKQYRDEYARGGIAGRIVDVMPDATWRGDPAFEIIEDEDPEKDTEFEKAWKDLEVKHQICSKFLRVDKLSRLSTYAVLLIGAPGTLDSELPKAKSPNDLLYLMPFSGGGGPGALRPQSMMSALDADCTIDELETDPKNPRFGLPKTYRLKRTDISSPELQVPVHWTRILHVAEDLLDDDVFGQPALERVWNLLIDLRKVTGGGAEAFWLRANQGVHLDVDKDMALPALKDTLEELKKQAETYKHQLDRWMRTRGVKATILGSDVANFANPADAVITQIAGSKGIPKRILTGSEMGELASSQDRENFKDLINGRQSRHAAPLVRQLVDRLIKYAYIPTPKKGPREYQVVWPHIQALTEQERSAGAKDWAATAVGGEPVFTDAEIRDKWYGMGPLTDEQRQEIADRKAEAIKMQQEAMGGPEEGKFPRAASAAGDEELIEMLAGAIEVGDADLVAQIVGIGDYEGRPLRRSASLSPTHKCVDRGTTLCGQLVNPDSMFLTDDDADVTCTKCLGLLGETTGERGA